MRLRLKNLAGVASTEQRSEKVSWLSSLFWANSLLSYRIAENIVFVQDCGRHLPIGSLPALEARKATLLLNKTPGEM
jgi:hypothetical protein